jgi:hypothetical protein
MKYRNARYNSQGTIDCIIDHPTLGPIPFTADPNDIEPHGREIFALLKDSATPYVADDPTAPN